MTQWSLFFFILRTCVSVFLFYFVILETFLDNFVWQPAVWSLNILHDISHCYISIFSLFSSYFFLKPCSWVPIPGLALPPLSLSCAWHLFSSLSSSDSVFQLFTELCVYLTYWTALKSITFQDFLNSEYCSRWHSCSDCKCHVHFWRHKSG